MIAPVQPRVDAPGQACAPRCLERRRRATGTRKAKVESPLGHCKSCWEATLLPGESDTPGDHLLAGMFAIQGPEVLTGAGCAHEGMESYDQHEQ